MLEYPQLAIKALISCEMQQFLKRQNNIEIKESLDVESGYVFMKNNKTNTREVNFKCH